MYFSQGKFSIYVSIITDVFYTKPPDFFTSKWGNNQVLRKLMQSEMFAELVFFNQKEIFI